MVTMVKVKMINRYIKELKTVLKNGKIMTTLLTIKIYIDG